MQLKFNSTELHINTTPELSRKMYFLEAMFAFYSVPGASDLTSRMIEFWQGLLKKPKQCNFFFLDFFNIFINILVFYLSILLLLKSITLIATMFRISK